jgi:hypothetical protein
MIEQSPLNVVLDVLPDQVEACGLMLAGMKPDAAGNSVLPFGRLKNVHFARLVLLPQSNKRVGTAFGARLILATNYDGDYTAHLRDLVATGGAGLTGLLGHCVGCPQPGDEAAVFAYLDRNRRKVNAFYINTIGRGVEQIAFEARLHGALQEHLDGSDYAGRSERDVHRALVDFVASRADLNDALQPVPERTLAARLAGWARIGALAIAGVGLALLFLPVTIALIVVLRFHELFNRPDNTRPLDAHIATLERDEDHGVHNQLAAVGLLQRGWFRNGAIRVGLWLLQLGSSYIFNNGKLAAVDTIHFARWVIIDKGARLYFFSNFDGSPESYQDDFIERVAFGLNLVFSNGVGWPRTHYLLFGGASDEQSLKGYYRDHQRPTDVWFVADAYRGSTAVNIANHAAIRKGLSGSLKGSKLHEWLQRL